MPTTTRERLIRDRDDLQRRIVALMQETHHLEGALEYCESVLAYLDRTGGEAPVEQQPADTRLTNGGSTAPRIEDLIPGIVVPGEPEGGEGA